MIYVDELKTFETQSIKSEARRYGRQWCHLHADTETELHEFAARLGLRRSWFQSHHKDPFFWHYDLTPSRRALAVKLGAREITTKQWVEQYLDRREVHDRGADPDAGGGDPGPD